MPPESVYTAIRSSIEGVSKYRSVSEAIRQVEAGRGVEKTMIRLKLFLPLAALLAAPAFAGDYSLNEWCFYVNSLDLNHSCAETAGGGASVSAPFQNISFDTTLGS